jgi:glycosyltransferase involved in cell wall biosynthesis
MKIVIAAWHLKDFNVGIGRYCRGLIAALGQVDKENEYHILMPEAAYRFPDFKNVHYHVIRFPLFKRRVWEQVAPQLVGRYDVLHFPHDSSVAWKRGKFIVTIHDVKPLLFGSYHQKRNLNTVIERMVIPNQSMQVDHVVTVSQWSKQDIARHLCLPQDQISVVPPGVDPIHFRPAYSLERNRSKRPYVLSVAGSDPTKNVETLVEAFAKLPPHLRESHDLVLAGDLRNRPEVHARVRQLCLEAQTSFPGVVAEDQLIALYQHAAVFVFPSRYEGFGLPVLEAMACGCPVISSNASSLPEVFGDAALSADPLDAAGFACHMEQLLSDTGLRQELRRKGLARASQFSWEQTAREMVKVYTKVGSA